MRCRMKITFICEKKNQFGGKEKYLSRLLKCFDKNEIPYSLINSPFKKFLPSWVKVFLFNLFVFSKKKDQFYFSLERITCADIYRAGDGVHKFFFENFNKSKLNPLHYINIFLEKKCFENSSHIIANSIMVKSQITKIYNVNSDKISVVYNGIDKNYCNPIEVKRIKDNLKIKGEKIFLFVGSGYKRKGAREFIDIISKLKKNKIKGLIIGKEKKINFYKDYAKRNNVENNILFLGPVKDVTPYYVLSDFFILPTHYEPFSNVVLEAMLHGNAVFTTCQNGAHEILKTEFIMTNPSDLAILDDIQKILHNQKLLEEIKISNMKIAEKYSIENNFIQTLKIIRATNN